MRPRISTGDEPPFHELDEYRFQKLCRDIMLKEPNIGTAVVYGVRGEKQNGIDILCYRRHNTGVEVGQCKRYRKFDPADITQASDEFLDEWSYWAPQAVKRFVLLVTADVSTTKHQEVIAQQKQRFLGFGIEYEVWPPEMIQSKLQNYPAIVARYLDDPAHWLQRICGVLSTNSWRHLLGSDTPDLPGSTAYHRDQLDELAGTLSVEFDRRLEQLRQAWREGHKDEPRGWLYEVKANRTVWTRISSPIRAKILRFEVRVTLELERDASGRPNTYHATELLDEAYRLEPNYIDYAAQALIAYYEGRVEDALALVRDVHNIERINVHAMLLLDLHRSDEASVILEHPTAIALATAETFRLRASTHLIKGELSQAQEFIKQAIGLEPHWESVRLTEAWVNYYSAISPILLPNLVSAGPEPVDWDFIKQDDISLSRLQSAIETFGNLAELAYDSRSRRGYLALRLASLANHKDRQEEAGELCKILLDEIPNDTLVLRWALTRGYPIDAAVTEKVMNQRIRAGTISVDDLITLIQFRITRQELQRGLSLLKRNKQVFEKNESLWQQLDLHLRVIKGELKAITAALAVEEHDTERLHLKSMALRKNAERTGDWQPLREHLENCWAHTGSVDYLIELADLLARQSDWDAIADRWADLAAIETPPPIQRAAMGLFNAGRYDTCLTLISQSSRLFRYGQLPPNMKGMKTSALVKLGRLSEASMEAAQLAELEPTVENHLVLVQIHLEQGDLLQLVVAARKLRSDPNLSAGDALRLASLTKSEDLELARAFWRQATTHPLDDDLVGPAYGVGMELGLDAELRDLTKHLVELASSGRGGIQAFSIPDLISFAHNRRTHHSELVGHYYKGNAPIHTVADILNISLLDLYHYHLTLKETALRGWSSQPLLALHGSRNHRITSVPTDQPWRLHVDITALLLAEHFELLDIIERTFAPLLIPAGVVPALLKLRQQAEHHQPSQLNTYRQLAKLIDLSRIHVANLQELEISTDPQLQQTQGVEWVKMYALAQKTGGYVVDFLPLSTLDRTELVTLPEGATQHLTSCKAVLEALRVHGPLTETQYTAAIQALGEEGRKIVDVAMPIPGRHLYCHGNIVEILINTGVMEIVAQRFHVVIEQEEAERARNAMLYEDHQQEMLTWLDELRGRISRGLTEGTYERMPETAAERSEREDSPDWILTRCPISLFAFPVQPDDVIWIDDRFSTEYIHRDGAPIVGIIDVLQAALHAGALNQNQYFEILNRMRASDVRYVPMESDEIVHALLNAHLDPQGSVVETGPLINLRRYAGRCLSQRDFLQWSPLPPRTPPHPSEAGELAFILTLSRAIDEAVQKIWSSDRDINTCRAYSSWIADNLMFDALMVRIVLGLSTDPKNYHALVAVHLTTLFVRGPEVFAQDVDDASLRRQNAYSEWIEHRLLLPRIKAEPSLLSAITDNLKATMSGLLDNVPEIPAQLLNEVSELPESFSQRLVAVKLQAFHERLPESIQNELEQDTEFMGRLGVHFRSIVQLGRLTFDQNVFWTALASVMEGSSTELLPVNSEERVRFLPLDNEEQGVFAIELLAQQQKLVVEDDIFRLVSNDASFLESLLRRNRHWFDCDDETFEATLSDVQGLTGARDRLELVDRWRHEHITRYYNELEDGLREQGMFQFESLYPQKVDALPRHFRVDGRSIWKSSAEMLVSASKTLLGNVGLVETIERLSRFPIALPSDLIDALAEAPLPMQQQQIKDLLMLRSSPLGAIHLIRILTRLGANRPSYHRLAKWVLRYLIRMYEDQTMLAFLALLRWIDEGISVRPAVREWTDALRLTMVWGHADKVFRIFRMIGADPAWIIDSFPGSPIYALHQLFNKNSQLSNDVSSPREQNPLSFLLGGLGYALAAPGASIDEDLLLRLFNLFFDTSSSTPIPSEVLFSGSGTVSNLLGSFLGDERNVHLEALFGPEIAGAVTKDIRIELFNHGVDKVEANFTDAVGWNVLYLTLGNQPPIDEFKQPIRAMLQQLNMVSLYQNNPQLGRFVLSLVSRLCLTLEYLEGSRKLYDQLIPLTQMLTDSERMARWQSEGGAISTEEHVREILAASIYLSIATYPDHPPASAFSNVLRSLIDVSPIVALVARPMVRSLCRDLPLEEAQHFWPILFRLWAE